MDGLARRMGVGTEARPLVERAHYTRTLDLAILRDDVPLPEDAPAGQAPAISGGVILLLLMALCLVRCAPLFAGVPYRPL